MSSNCTPLASVVIPLFNTELYIAEAICSVLHQTYDNLELIIIDDGSTDSSAEVVRSLIESEKAKNVQFISRENRGMCRTLNDGMAIAKGKYFAYLGSDDMWRLDKIELQVGELEKAESAAAFSDCMVIDSFGKFMSCLGNQFPYRGGNIYEDLIWFSFQPASPTNLFRRDVLELVGRFNEDQHWEDRDLWLRIAKDYEISYIDLPLAMYRVHGKNGSLMNLEVMYAYSHQVLDAAVKRDPALMPFLPRMRADIDAFQAGAYVEALKMKEARRYAYRSLWRRPLSWLAWRSLLLSLAGKSIVLKIRNRRREATKKRSVFNGN